MRGEAAVDGNAEVAGCPTDVFITDFTGCALPATDPRINGDLGPRLCARVGSATFNYARNLVAKCEGQSAPGAYIEFLAVAQQKKAILHVQVGVADATAVDPHENFSA